MSIQSLEIIISAVMFILAVFVCFYVPGSIVRKWLRLRRESSIDIASAFVLGMSLFTLIALIAGFLNAGWLRWLYIALFLFMAARDNKLLSLPKVEKAEIVLFTVAASLFSLTMILSGWSDEQGIRFYGVNIGDGIWHVALINEMTYTFPPQHPGIAGIALKGYHFFYDFLLAQFQSMFGISSIHLLFHFFPFVISGLWAVGLYGNALRWFQSKVAGYFAVLFGMFGGSFAYLVPLIWKQSVSLDDGLGVTQPFTALVNPQFASSMTFVLFSLISFREYLQEKSWRSLVPLVLLGVVAGGFKVYAGLILVGSLFVAASWNFLATRKFFSLVVASIATTFGAWLLFRPFNEMYGYLVYQFLWPPHRVMQSTLDFTKWEVMRQTYELYGSIKGLVKMEVWAFAVFFFGNLGTRLFGLIAVLVFAMRLLRHNSQGFLQYFMALIGISFIVPLFFIQPTAGPFNMIQMYWYFIVLISLPSAGGMSFFIDRIRNRNVATVIIALVVLATAPSFIEKLASYTSGTGAHIDRSRYEALRSLALVKQYTDVTLEIPMVETNKPEELESWFYGRSDPHIPALGYKRAYLNEETVAFPYDDVKRRILVMTAILQPMHSCPLSVNIEQCNQDLNQSRSLLDHEGISIVFSPNRFEWLSLLPGVQEIYSNIGYKIYDVHPL